MHRWQDTDTSCLRSGLRMPLTLAAVLSVSFCRRGSDKPPGLLPEWNEYAKTWMGPFVMEAINSRCGAAGWVIGVQQHVARQLHHCQRLILDCHQQKKNSYALLVCSMQR